ncbi:MAG: hypothetical protein AAF762_08605 [Pseudomonadota bacterium]
MTLPAPRYLTASALAVTLALFATVFARQTHNHLDMPTFLDPLEWVSTLLFLIAGWAAYQRREQLAALLMVAALFTFYGVQAAWLFRVPLGFGVLTAGALLFLFILPVTWKPK